MEGIDLEDALVGSEVVAEDVGAIDGVRTPLDIGQEKGEEHRGLWRTVADIQGPGTPDRPLGPGGPGRPGGSGGPSCPHRHQRPPNLGLLWDPLKPCCPCCPLSPSSGGSSETS